ncbi:MAG: UDP-3-O-(3-hydroxymyristoyl)glucosamine N-acyltransferase [Campylobacterales bacterium]
MKLSELCRHIELDYAGEDREISAIQTLDEATENELSFVEQDRYLECLATTKAAAVLVRPQHADQVPPGTVALVTREPYLMMAKASALFARPLIKTDGKEAVIGEGSRVLGSAYIGRDTVIGKNCLILPGAYIGDDVMIGDDVVIHPNAAIYNRSQIGSRCVIHAGTVIGCDGFGYAHTREGTHVKIQHFGRVVIEDDVEIAGNTVIDRAVFGTTLIKKGTKIDNLVHIAHNVEIGEHSLLTAQVGFAGSAKTGRNFVAGGQAGIAGHLKIADFVTIAAKSGVTKSIEKGGTYAGFPHMEHRLWLRLQAKIQQLLK